MQRDPHETADRVGRFRKTGADEAFFDVLNRTLEHAPLPGADDARLRSLPIIYIVGVPRSGTTLLSQLVSRYLPVGYIDNLIARFWLRPSAGIRLSRAVLGPSARQGIGFESTHGTTSGIAGPHEFGYFWRRWLRLDEMETHRLGPESLAQIDAEGLRNALEREVLEAFAAPAVFKNVICGLQAEFLARIHPQSLFVMIHRDPVEAAASILESRRARYGSYDAWWSLKPSTYREIARMADPVEQVARQVADLRREFRTELSRPGVEAMDLDYRELCADPAAALRAIAARAAALGGADLPLLEESMPVLAPSGMAGIDPDAEHRLRSALAALGA